MNAPFDVPISLAGTRPAAPVGCCPRYLAGVDAPPEPIGPVVETLERIGAKLIRAVGEGLRIAGTMRYLR